MKNIYPYLTLISRSLPYCLFVFKIGSLVGVNPAANLLHFSKTENQ